MLKEGCVIRKTAVVGFICLLFLAIGLLFWYNEWIYSLPTPVPADYRPISQGSVINLTDKFNLKSDKPLFIHFFNPDCPCSRFNIAHFKILVAHYDKSVNFAIVVTGNKGYTAKYIRDEFDLQLPVSFDSAIAVTCGVYSTPQAVLITAGHHLYYRGNYNRSRYCADKKTNYAQIALEAMLHGVNTNFDHYASTAYGCKLPYECSK